MLLAKSVAVTFLINNRESIWKGSENEVHFSKLTQMNFFFPQQGVVDEFFFFFFCQHNGIPVKQMFYVLKVPFLNFLQLNVVHFF